MPINMPMHLKRIAAALDQSGDLCLSIGGFGSINL